MFQHRCFPHGFDSPKHQFWCSVPGHTYPLAGTHLRQLFNTSRVFSSTRRACSSKPESVVSSSISFLLLLPRPHVTVSVASFWTWTPCRAETPDLGTHGPGHVPILCQMICQKGCQNILCQIACCKCVAKDVRMDGIMPQDMPKRLSENMQVGMLVHLPNRTPNRLAELAETCRNHVRPWEQVAGLLAEQMPEYMAEHVSELISEPKSDNMTQHFTGGQTTVPNISQPYFVIDGRNTYQT